MSKAYCTICCKLGHNTLEHQAGAVAMVERASTSVRRGRPSEAAEPTHLTPSWDYLHLRVAQLEAEKTEWLAERAGYERQIAQMRGEAERRGVSEQGRAMDGAAGAPTCVTVPSHAHPPQEGHPMATESIYCLKCRAHKDVHAHRETSKNGRPQLSGTCPTCGKPVHKFVKA